MKIERVNTKYQAVTFKTISFIIILVVIAQVIFSVRFAQTEEKRQLKDLNSTILSYHYNISEKLSILTSSNTFLDFLRSGELSRQEKVLDMDILFSNFKDQTIEGVSIYKIDGERIFNFGSASALQLTLKLCYLNDFLDSKLGSCRHLIKINFSVENLVSRLKTMNPNIEYCKSCSTPFEVEKNRLGSFDSVFTGKVNLPISLGPVKIFSNLILFEIFFLLILFFIFFIVHRAFGKISKDYIYTPLKEIVSALSSGQTIDLSKVSIYEIKFLGEAINNFISESKDQEELRRSASLGQMATQVAHDIRSPLEMLKGLKDEIAPLPSDSRRRIQMSINRIEEITFNLLKTNKRDNLAATKVKSEELLGPIISVITEKNIEYRGNQGVEILDLCNTNSFGLFSKIQRSTLKSIISNIINNAVESFNGGSGTIKIILDSKNDQNIISIIDNGPSISPEIRNKIFTKGFTTKKNGNGIGLFNAKQDLEAVGGTIGFESELGKGTTFTIILPKSETPKSFIGSIDAYKYERIIVLDDDPAFHEVWNKRLEGLESKVEHIHSVEEMFSKYQVLHPKILLLSDFELMDKHLDGIDTILKLGHSEHSVLVTARNEEKAIQDRCLAAGIKLLPKSLVNYARVVSEPSGSSQDSSKLGSAGMVGDAVGGSFPKASKFDQVEGSQGSAGESYNKYGDQSDDRRSDAQDRKNQKPSSAGEKYGLYIEGGQAGSDNAQSSIILIDDDRLVHLNWKTYCKRSGLEFSGFMSINDFMAASASFDKASRIYIDSNLGDGIKGEIESEKIFALGFLNLYLATGYEKDSISKPKWIKEIYSKSPENIG
jgi:signal transduction histidine kinase